MKILAFEGTAKIASVALVEDGREVGSFHIDNGLTQSELLLPMAEAMLKSLKIKYDDADAFAATVGPGSFTGVRIGVSLVKGLAFGKNKPCIAVSTLEALAENMSGIKGLAVPVMDAKRGQVYTALFRSDGKNIKRLTEDIAISFEELKRLISKHKRMMEKVYLLGEGSRPAWDALTTLGVKIKKLPALLINENAVSLARVAERKLRSGDILSDLEITPKYLRLPQAERERLEKLEKNQK